MKPDRKTCTLEWGEVSYLEWKPLSAPRGQDVLLLHGGGVDSAHLSWAPLGRDLARKGYRVIAPDAPGYGGSDAAPWPVTQRRLDEFVGEFVAALELDRYMLGGLSMGGGMALGHTLEHPEQVRALILFASYGLSDYQFDSPISSALQTVTWATVRSGLLDAVQRGYAKRRSWMERSLHGAIRDPERITDALVDEVMQEAEKGTAFTAFTQWQRDQIRWNRMATNHLDRLSEIDLPVLIVQGGRDSAVPVSSARAAAARLSDAQLLLIDDAGHWIQRDQPEEVGRTVIEFVQGN
ncbi:MAG: alpha/beta fold hydrolase [Agrococcus casei]|uniref:alpha/beta fold hydrolase n=1 Tax=Agrococcus casei TaxID=343512 RepID=UPI003F979EFA